MQIIDYWLWAIMKKYLARDIASHKVTSVADLKAWLLRFPDSPDFKQVSFQSNSIIRPHY